MSVDTEYQALRTAAGGRVVERDVVRLWGPDALDYLQGQCSQDVAALEVGATADALLLEPQGKIDALVRVVRRAEDEFSLDTDGGFGPVVVERLQRFKLRIKAEMALETVPVTSVRGPSATLEAVAEAMSGTLTEAETASRSVAFAWGSVVGTDVFGVDTVPDAIVACGQQSWEALRVEAGIVRMGAEIDERTIAAEAGLLERCVSFTKGCYTGQELVARLDARGNKVARRLRGVVAGEPELVAGAELTTGDRLVGSLASVVCSPRLGWIGLAYVHRSVEPGATVAMVGPAGPVQASVRALPLVD